MLYLASKNLITFHKVSDLSIGCLLMTNYLNDAIMMFKCINKLVLNYLIGKFTLRAQTHSRNTRQRSQLYLLRCRTTTGQRSFTYRNDKLWNDLRDNVKSSDSVNVLKKRLVNLFSDKSMNLEIVNPTDF